MKKLFKNLMPMLLLVAGLGISPNAWAGQYNLNWQGKVYFRAPDNWDLSTYSHVQVAITRTTSTTSSDYVFYSGDMTRVGSTRLYFIQLSIDHSSWGQNEYIAFTANSSTYGAGTHALNPTTHHYTTPKDYGCNNSSNYYLFNPDSEDNGATVSASWKNNRDELVKLKQTINLYTGGSSSNAGGSVKITGYYFTSDNAVTSGNKTSSSASVSYETAVGSEVKLEATPTTGYQFDGWYTAATGGTKESSDATYTYTCKGTKTLYARFSAKSYNITYSPASAPTGCSYTSAPPSGTFGSTVSMTITPATGYTVSVTSTDVSISQNGNVYSFTMPAKAVTINVSTTEVLTSVTISSNGNGTVSPTSANVGVATTQSVSATPADGYHFASWAVTGNADIKSQTTANPVTLYGNGSGSTGTLTATFAETTYEITVAAGANGSVASNSVSAGQITPVALPTATPADGYNFKNWTATEGITITNSTSADEATIIATKAGTVTANFENAATYSLTVAAGTGIASVTGSQDDITLGQSYSITATVKAGYTWSGWAQTSGAGTAAFADASSQNTNVTVTVGSVEVTASATPNNNTPYKVYHYQQNLADDGYTLVDTDNLTGTTDAQVTPAVKNYEGFTAPSTQTVTIKGDGTTVVEYQYARKSYNISYTVQAIGWTYGEKPVTAKYEQEVSFVVTPSTGYTVTVSSEDAQLSQAGNTYTFTMPAKAVAISVSATENKYNVTVDNGSVSNVVQAGIVTNPQITAVNKDDQVFDRWECTGGASVANATSQTTTVSATSEGTVTATYRDKTLVKLYFANYAEWPTVKAYAYGNGEGNNNTWPGELTTEETINCVTYKVFSYYSEDHSWTTVIFNNGQDNDNCKTEDLTIAGNEGKYYMPNGWKQGSTGLLTGAWQAEPYATLWAFHVKKDGADHGQDYLVSCDNNQTTASLEANTHYVFKAHNYVTGKWYGNNNSDSYIRGSIENWDFYSENTGDCNMQTTEAGTYTFAISQFVTSSQIKVSVTYPTAQTFAVTISAGDNGSVEPNGEQQVDAFNGIAVTAKPNPGYRFKQWVTSDGVTVTNSTSATTTVKASQAGTLQATFTTEGMIYFNKAGIKDKWQGDVYVYFYKGEYWDKDGKGSGSSTSGNCTSGPRKMTRLGNSQIYYFDYAGAGITKQSKVISFTDKELNNVGNFYQCSASYRTDFDECANMFVPRDYIDYYNECAYYSKGYWRTFQSTDPGYDITIWNSQDGKSGEKDHGDFVGTSNLSNDFTFTATLDGNHTYGFKISSCGGTWYGNQGTMTQDCNWEFDSEGNYDKNCGLTTTATGEYKFTLNCTDGWLRVSVEYPLSVGDYRLAYEESNGVTISDLHPTHFIKAIKEDGTKKDTVSFFVQQKANACIHLQKCTHIDGTNITWANENGKKVDLNDFTGEAGVYNFTLTQTKSGATLTSEVALLEAYKGPYYIRTDCAGGGWSAYDIADNKMTQTDILAQNTDGFDHYFVKWISANTNVKYCVANDYSEALTDSLPGDTYIGEDNQTLPKEANVRFMWNSKTNALERAYLSGSTNTEDRYLVLEGDARMFFADGKEIGEGTDADHRKGLREHELPFEDKNNWVYQADIKAKPNCAVKLTAAYNNNVQYFIGKADGDEASSRKTIIAGSGDDKYKMRVVYDFKTNLLIAGWIPSDTIKSEISLGGDMLITRTHQDSAQQIIFGTDEAKITDIHHVYGVLTLKKDTMTNAATMSTDDSTGKYYENNLYWISFPFEVKISEIFGVDGYGTKWIIQRYRGDLRAQKGWFAETPTFWEYMSQEETLKAYEGYVLCLDPNYFYPTDAEVWNNNATEANFYFPSASGEIGIVHAANYDQTVLPHECKINREFNVEGIAGTQNHTMTDSHWNVIGVPAFQNANGSVVPEEGNTKFKSFYEWNPKTNGYTPQVVDKNYAFKTMHAYMVQFYGTINWTNVSIISNEIAAAPYRYADNKNYMIELFFNGNGAEDHTYIKLADEASTDFVLNEDMMKLDNAGYPNIYSFAGNYNVAYNETKMDNQTVTLGVSAPKAGTYTFAMPNQFSGTAKLIDLVEGITTDLNISNYSVDLSKSTYNDRFQLLLEVEAKAPTSIENVDGSLWNEDGKTTKILHNGNIYLINAGRVYNATGTMVR